ncbi:unnamed protein product [Paramecium primaurelia]|uniref:RRM domain-containing protein n=2 Tax=Paramecium TaxID=5884 RepID=A0A8S1UIF7_9CILI|nr:unnamed protein product [Paramecium primaurelia]CAD8162456.1 unnamed protein product [Paramecium pentaurelia]
MDKKKLKKKVDDSDSSDLEQLLEISKKYKNRPRPEKQEIPILKKVKPPEPPPQPPQPTTLPQLSSFKKSESGAYKVPQHLHKNYPHAVRLYLGNLPDNVDKDHLHNYIRQQMESHGAVIDPGDPVIQVQLQPGQKYCFVQFRSIEETEAALQIDTSNYQGKQLKFKRVKDYEISPRIEGEREVPKIQPKEPAQKLFVCGLAPDTDNDALANILSEYGSLKSLNVVRDIKNVCKGFAFCEFETDLETQNCVNGLNNKVIGGRLLQVKKNAQLPTPTQDYIIDTITLGEQQAFESKLQQINQMKVSSVVVINNAVRIKNIEDDYEYNFIVKDLKKEIEKIGRLISMVVPRKKDGYSEGIGKVFVEFENEQFAKIAIILLQNKKYDGREIDISFYDPRLYADKQY